MSETCYNVPPDRDVIVLDQDNPAGTATALIAAAVAAGFPVNVVRYQPETGGFLVPAAIANIDTDPGLPAPPQPTVVQEGADPMSVRASVVGESQWYYYSFDFGDGAGWSTPTYSAVATHTYTAPGGYNVVLKVSYADDPAVDTAVSAPTAVTIPFS